MQKIVSVFVLLLLLGFSSCELAGDIFKTGMGVGIFIVVAIILVIIFVISKVSGGSK